MAYWKIFSNLFVKFEVVVVVVAVKEFFLITQHLTSGKKNKKIAITSSPTIQLAGFYLKSKERLKENHPLLS